MSVASSKVAAARGGFDELQKLERFAPQIFVAAPLDVLEPAGIPVRD